MTSTSIAPFRERHLRHLDVDRIRLFQNIGSTRREGGDLDITYQTGKVSAYLQYSYLAATFRSPLLEPSPGNPFQDDDGNIQVNVGDQLPLIPKNRVKLGADVAVLPGWSVGGTVSYIGRRRSIGATRPT